MSGTQSSTGEAQRPHTRYHLASVVEIRESSLRGPVLGQLRNISLSGCYVSTPRKIAEHTRVRIILHTSSLKADLWGIIRRQDPDGMGIQFTNGASVEDWKSLESIIHELQTVKQQATWAGV